MPQAKVYGLRDQLVPVRTAVSDAINESIAEAFKFPRERRLQRFFPMDRDDFVYPASERSERYLIIEIETFEGRSAETKKELVRQICRRIHDATGIDYRDIDVIISEQPRHNWGLMGEPGDEIQLGYKVSV